MNEKEFKFIKYNDIIKNRYLIYTDGRIYDTEKKIFKKFGIFYPRNHKGGRYDTGYFSVSLRTKERGTKTFMVHRLVATAFIPNPNNYPMVNHIDGNKTNPNASNLEWCDAKHNNIHAIETGLRKIGEDAPNATCTKDQVKQICEMLSENKYKNKYIAETVGVPYYIIHNIKSYNSWVRETEGYEFKKQQRIDESKAREICEFIELGFKLKEISKMLNVTHKTVLNIRDGNTWKDISCEYTFPREKPHITEEDANLICKYLKDKVSVKEISKLTGVCTNVIYKIHNRSSWTNISKDYEW